MEQLEAEDELYYRSALEAAKVRLRTAPATVRIGRLKNLMPAEKARQCWSRMRDKNVDPKKIIEAGLMIHLMARERFDPELRKQAFREVQAAKIVHRLAGPTEYKVVETLRRNGPHWERHTMRKVIRGQDEGRLLRYLGRDVLELTELIDEHHLARVGDGMSTCCGHGETFGQHIDVTKRPIRSISGKSS